MNGEPLLDNLALQTLGLYLNVIFNVVALIMGAVIIRSVWFLCDCAREAVPLIRAIAEAVVKDHKDDRL